MQLNMIMAHSLNRVIGYKGKIPWKCPEDTEHFKATTMGYPVIMGRATWLSLPAKVRPLPGRKNIVLSRTMTASGSGVDGAIVCGSVIAVMNVLDSIGADEAWVMGGENVYRLFMPIVNRVSVTEIQGIYTGDAWAPHLVSDTYRLTMGPMRYSVASQLTFRVLTYDRDAAVVERMRDGYRKMRV